MTRYGACRRGHADLGGKIDGCQEFMVASDSLECAACGCHRNFHLKLDKNPPAKYVTKVVYTKCHKVHFLQGCNGVDGCQEFTAATDKEDTDADAGLFCVICRCHKVFHRNEIRVLEDVSPLAN